MYDLKLAETGNETTGTAVCLSEWICSTIIISYFVQSTRVSEDRLLGLQVRPLFTVYSCPHVFIAPAL